MKKIIFMIVFVALSSFVNAQVQWNVKAGLNVSTLTGANADMKVGYHLGVGAELPLAKSFYLQPSFLLTAKGATGSSFGFDATINPIYLELPVMFAYKIPVSKSSNFVLSAGPYFAYGIAGKVSIESEGVEANINCFGSGDHDLGMERFDLGLGIGGALEFNKFLVGLNVSYGLLNVAPEIYDGTSHNVNIGLSVGYRF